jgi:hypothetical protein
LSLPFAWIRFQSIAFPNTFTGIEFNEVTRALCCREETHLEDKVIKDGVGRKERIMTRRPRKANLFVGAAFEFRYSEKDLAHGFRIFSFLLRLFLLPLSLPLSLVTSCYITWTQWML